MLIYILLILYTFLTISGIISYTIFKGYGGLSITIIGCAGLIGTTILFVIIQGIQWIINLF